MLLGMVVGIDIRVLAKGERGGIPQYTRRLLESLIPFDPAVRYKLFFSSGKEDMPQLSFLYPNARLFTFRFPNRLLAAAALVGSPPRFDELMGGVDVWWSPHFHPVSISTNLPRVITAHDLSFVAFPEFLSWKRKIWHKIFRPKKQLGNAAKIIAVSHSTADDLLRLFKIPPESIRVIHSGIDPPRLAPGTYPIGHAESPQILFVSVLEPRKNLSGVLSAFEILKKRLRESNSPFQNVRLVIAGPVGWQWRGIKRAFDSSPFRKDCKFLGFVNEEEKQRMFSQSRVFVYPSFMEGFGFPPLEAMSQGLPVIAGANSSLNELLCDAAILVDAWQPAEIAQALQIVLQDSHLRQELISRGLEAVKHHSWRETARQTLNVLREVAGK